jgi:hypothetical protein
MNQNKRRRCDIKFLTYSIYDVNKTAEIAALADQVWTSPPSGMKVLSSYVCQGMPFQGVPPNSLVAIQIIEAESNEVLAAVQYPMALAGASIHTVPVLEVTAGTGAETERKYRG